LFADLPQHHVLNAVTKPFTPESLLQRYNLALAQALLYRATEMTITLKSDFKIVWKYIKLARLIHEIEKLDDGYRIRLTGPVSVFRYTQRYGIRMALFLPGLLLAKQFTMEAVTSIHDQERFFRLDEQCGLHSHYAETPEKFDSSLEETFYESFRSIEKQVGQPARGRGSSPYNVLWKIEREADLIDLGDTVLIPDFTFIHEDGRKAMLEIVGFWTPEYIEKKLNKLSRVREANLIVALSNSLNCARVNVANLQDKKLLFFKGVLKVKDVLECLEQM
jgi:predicted nuclease of restriction endonuclease-like RecB superfamily